MVLIRKIAKSEYPLLKTFLFEAIFVPEGIDPPSRDIVDLPELSMYYQDFGQSPGDIAYVAELEGQVIGLTWTRIMPDYGHIDNETPSISIALFSEYRGQAIGSQLLLAIFEELKDQDFKSVSLSVKKANRAQHLYKRLGFQVVQDKEDELIMRRNLYN